jgi:ABC-type glutathione transport system ATPase component
MASAASFTTPPVIAMESNSPIRFVCPGRIGLIGPTMAGKSTFLDNLVSQQKEQFSHDFAEVIYCHPDDDALPASGVRREHILSMEKSCRNLNVVFKVLNGSLDGVVESALAKYSNDVHRFIIFDDYAMEKMSFEHFLKYVAKSSHQLKDTIAIVFQDFHSNNKNMRSIIRNLSEIVFFLSPADKSYAKSVSRELLDNPDILDQCMTFLDFNVHSRKDRYIVLDNNPLSALSGRLRNMFCLRTQIFTDPVTKQNRTIYFSLK